MWIAERAAHTHVAIVIVAVLVVAGIFGMVTTHKGNKGHRGAQRRRR